MIELTKFSGKTFVLNAELIQTIESTPDTVVTLTTGKK
ncbi:MAG TPA: flagellar FlbD family protein, partial [Thermoanaerobacterales bacterium]|nr:flagellar FlbD family protein [Thermoanaerobacterales bacterium]